MKISSDSAWAQYTARQIPTKTLHTATATTPRLAPAALRTNQQRTLLIRLFFSFDVQLVAVGERGQQLQLAAIERLASIIALSPCNAVTQHVHTALFPRRLEVPANNKELTFYTIATRVGAAA